MENMQPGMGGKVMCKCPHHKVVPILIIILGLTFLLGNWGTISWSTVNTIWPVLIIIGGLMKLMNKSGMCKCC